MRKLTVQEAHQLKTSVRGFNKTKLAELGIPWPPPHGWRRKLLLEAREKPLSIYERANTLLTPMQQVQLKRDIRAIIDQGIRMESNWPQEFDGLTEQDIQDLLDE